MHGIAVRAPATPHPLKVGEDESVVIVIAFTPIYDSFALEQLRIGVDGGDVVYVTSEVVAAVGAEDGAMVVLTLTGNLIDGTPSFGRSCASVMIHSPANSAFRRD